MLDSAHAQEARGRIDIAAQKWQQVLLADPNNTEALGGLARAARMQNNEAEAQKYLQRLRAIDPNDPGITRAESVMSSAPQVEKLNQAGKLAQAGQYTEAMKIYHDVFGDNPPPGDWALAYYETESATETGRDHAIQGLRNLVSRYPSDTRYQVALGRILTYNAKTRPEGRRLLQRHPKDPQAMEAYRQSLVWDAQSPSAMAEVRGYLKTHKDPELQQALRNAEAAAARARRSGVSAGPAPDSPEMIARREHDAELAAAYAALNAKRLEEAEARFKTLLAKDSHNAQALAGMGYVRMNQSNFGGAVSFLEQARQEGSRDPGVDRGLATSRFWYTMGEGSIAINENDLATAEKNYRAALQMRPGSPEALEGLAGTLMKANEYAAAVTVYEQYVRLKPQSSIAWRGLFVAQYQAGNPAMALTTEKRIPSAVHAQLMRDPEFLRVLASAYSSVGRDADAQRVLRSALELPFPSGAEGVKPEIELQYASLLQQANRLDQAAGLYRQVLNDDPANVGAWQGLVRVQHAMKADPLAQQTIESMPPSVYDQAMRDPGFMGTAASVYQINGKNDVAQGLLERAIAAQQSNGQKANIGLQVQLASLYLRRGQAQPAYNIFRQVLLEHPDSTDSWKGLLDSLHASGHDREALAQIQQIPPETRKHLENDVDYLQTVGGIYNGLGQPREAMIFLARVQAKYRASHENPPADIDIQNAWLLFNGGNDTGLYRELMMLGGRNDLTDEQRRAIQTIWANWSVRRANLAMSYGYNKRGIAILNAAARAFPDNPGVYKALASGYLKAGVPKQAVEIFKTQDMTSATAADYHAAIGSALAANDLKDAEAWLRFGLQQYPRDSQMLSMAAKFEQARGDSNRAADYYRASLAAMPPPDPGAELADELSRPVASMRPPTMAQQQDLAQLLAPGTDPSTSPGSVADAPMEPQRPYLPSYGGVYGQAPVVLTPDGQPAGAALVPQYMVNPSRQSAQPLVYQQRPAANRLGDYVPQASVSPGTDMLPLGTPAYQPTTTAQGDDAYLDFQREQIRRATQQAQASGATIPAQPLLGDNRNTAANGTPGAVIASSDSQIYGPYIPYQGQGSSVATVPLYSARVTPVHIPESGLPPVELISSTQTDIDAPMRYVPNAPAASATSIHPDIAAYDAAAIRNQQSEPTARTLTLTPLGTPADPNMVGQSSAPGRVDVAQDAPMQQTQYSSGGYSAPAGQSTRPSSLPAMGNSGNDNFQNDNSFSANDRSLTLGQQYPRPTGRATTGSYSPAPRRIVRRAAAPAVAPGPAYAPFYYPAVPTQLTEQPYPQLPGQFQLGTAPSDQQLIARNLPPLRGPWDPNAFKETGPPLTERQQAELDLNTLEASYSGWLGGTASVRFRNGAAGMYRLFDYEAPFEASVVAGKAVRFTVVPKAVFLNSGALNTADYASLTNNVPILGTLPANATNPPAQQFSSGVGGEFQITSQNFGVAVGYTPYQFLVNNWTGRFRWKVAGGPVTFFADRDSVKDTQLSYAGLRDPGTVTPVFNGNIWGGVVSTGGGVRIDFGDEKAGFYASVDGAALTGYHVLDNRRYEGSAGAYFRVKQIPGVGTLSIGGNFFGMHYNHNELGVSYGQGGYFSPEAYFLGSVPITFTGYSGDRWHYVVSGGLGIQTFNQAAAPIYPLDTPLQQGATSGCTLPSLSSKTCGYNAASGDTGANFNVDGEFSYRYGTNWFLGGFAKANNTSNYNTGTIGFFVRYTFKKQYATEDYPTGLFPTEGFRPLRVP